MIRFTCSNCSRLIRVEDKYAGKKGKCPKCGNAVVVPERSTVIEFNCDSCAHKIRVPAKHGGKGGRCPKCRNPVVVPSLEKASPEDTRTVTVACSMCGQTMTVSEDSHEELVECPQCGSFVNTVPESRAPEVTEADPPALSSTDAELYEEGAEAYPASAGVDRRLVMLISAVALITVLGLVILAVALRPSQPAAEVAGMTEDSGELQLEQVQQFVEQ